MQPQLTILLIGTALLTVSLAGCGKPETPAPAVIEQPATTAPSTVDTAKPSPLHPPAEPAGSVRFLFDIPPEAKAILSIDGNDYAPSELAEPFSLPTGEHSIALKLGGKEVSTRRITVVPNKRQIVEVGEPHRQAARWALGIGGELLVQADGKLAQVKKVEDLPPGPFQVVHISLANLTQGGFKDADLALLAPLTDLTRVDLGRSDVSDDALRHFEGLIQLQELSLFACPRIDGSGFQHLKNLPMLRGMTLHGTRVGDVGLSHLKARMSLDGLNLIDCPITDSGLEQLAGLSRLHYLDISGTQITDSGLRALAGLANLGTLGLSRTRITDAGLAHLRSLENLTGLGLERTQLGGEGLVNLKPLVKLHHLNLNDTSLEDEGLAPLGELPNLDELWLARTKITDRGLEQLGQSRRWTWFSLDGTAVTDAGLEHLKNLENLHSLGLHSTQVTDAGLAHLKGLKSLRELGLSNTRVSEAGIADLKSALPNCNIHK